MATLSPEQQELFRTKIVELRRQLNELEINDTLQSLNRFENQLTLNELEVCLYDSEPEKLNANLKFCFSKRWERIRNSNMCYTQQPDNLVNQLCIELARAIAPPAETEEEIDKLVELEPKSGPYFLLMPSLKEDQNTPYGENIHSFRFHEFILSNNELKFIPVVQCLDEASKSDDGQLKHMVGDKVKHIVMGKEEMLAIYPNLSPGEAERVSNHSEQANELYQAVVALNKQRIFGEDFSGKLHQLAVALWEGGAHGDPEKEFNAGAAATEGIFVFHEYWNALPEQQKSAILTKTPKLKDLLGQLFRPKDANYQEVRYCVQGHSKALEPIIRTYKTDIKEIELLKEKVQDQKSAFVTAAKNGSLAITPNPKPPKLILPLIFTLNPSEQEVILKDSGYKNAWMYALAHEPEALSEFENLNLVDEKLKQDAIEATFNPSKDPALIIAAKHGAIKAIQLLLSWGAPIEARNIHQSTALLWAANNGHVNVVACLLDNDASLNARDIENNTALKYAISSGKGDVVKLLLEQNARVNVRNKQGYNALDIALAKHPEFIEPILMQIATLSNERQKECLFHVGYSNVLFYAAAQKPSLFDALVDETLKLKQPDRDSIIQAKNIKGQTPLIMAAKLGASESIRKLLATDLKLDIIESQDVHQSTALHWATVMGHMDVVTCLLDNGASLKARNNKGVNALDIAMASQQPELLEPILMQVVTWPVEEQNEYLSNVFNARCPNILFLAASVNKPSFFNALVDKIIEQPKLSQAILNASNNSGITPLMLTAQVGAHASIPKLLALGKDIEGQDIVDIEAHDDNFSTALHWAIHYERVEAVESLLKHGASLTNRNVGLKNALDLAMANHPKLLDPILRHLINLPIDKQTECLSNVSKSLYPNILFLAAKADKPSLFNALVDHILKQPGSEAIFGASNKEGLTPLMLAAQIGAHESISKLLAVRPKIVDIEARTTQNDTALYWAVYNGHIEAVKCLLDEKPSLVNARGFGNMKTALNWAVWQGRGAMVDLLLERNAKVNVISVIGNALNIARLKQPELIKPILMQMATLPIKEQQKCLSNVTERTYPNVLFYVAAEYPSVFNELILKLTDKELSNIIFHSKDQNGLTPLMLAARVGAHDSIPRILDSDPNIEARDGHKSTALHWAARNGHVEAVREFTRSRGISGSQRRDKK